MQVIAIASASVVVVVKKFVVNVAVEHVGEIVMVEKVVVMVL